VRTLVTEVVVCDPRHNKLLQSGNKNDRVDAQKRQCQIFCVNGWV
jgi:hypothetical protein